ncbi:MAG: glycerol-3-phosphate acyltransferase [Planctomycetota bacterium]
MTGPAVYWIGCFLLGSVPFALLLGFIRNVDIRTVGSHNVGATNLGRTVGPAWGFIAFLLDAGKGAGAVIAGRALLTIDGFEPVGGLLVIGAAAAILGHCFSPFLRFRGGKGVASAAGALVALAPTVTLVVLIVWLFVLAITRTIGIASSAAAVGAVILGVDLTTAAPLTGIPTDRWLGGFLIALGGLVLVKHRGNLAQFFRRRLRPNLGDGSDR